MRDIVPYATDKLVFDRFLNPQKSTGVMRPGGLLAEGARTKGRASGAEVLGTRGSYIGVKDRRIILEGEV